MKFSNGFKNCRTPKLQKDDDDSFFSGFAAAELKFDLVGRSIPDSDSNGIGVDFKGRKTLSIASNLKANNSLTRLLYESYY